MTLQQRLHRSDHRENAVDRSAFAKAVADALRGFHDPVHLQISPLVTWLSVRDIGPGQAPASRRRLLRNAVERLRPSPSLASSRPEWLGYRLLWSTYVQTKSRYVVCDELGLSEASYYRIRREALAGIVSVLWSHHEALTSSPASTHSSEETGDHQLLSDQMTRIAAASMQQYVNLAEVIASAEEIAAPLLQKEGLALRIDAPKGLPLVRGDPVILRQIVLGVLTEAIGLSPKDPLILKVRHCGDHISCSLGNLGAAPWPDTDTSGAERLGITRSLLSSHGGSLAIHDRNGKLGISFDLPVMTLEIVLIVGDDEDTRRLYRRYLEGEHYLVEEAPSAQALRRALADGKPDLVLLDVLMPREDGWDILRYLKSDLDLETIPVVVCSVLSQPQLALAMGASRVLHKPIQQEALLSAIREALPQEHSGL